MPERGRRKKAKRRVHTRILVPGTTVCSKERTAQHGCAALLSYIWAEPRAGSALFVIKQCSTYKRGVVVPAPGMILRMIAGIVRKSKCRTVRSTVQHRTALRC